MSQTVLLRAPGEGTAIPAGPTVTTIKVAGSHSEGRIGVVEFEFQPGFWGPPEHVHKHVNHVWYVLAGRIVVIVGSERAELEAGACAFVPCGTPHSLGNAGHDVARVLEVDTPVALDRYFEELGEAFPAGSVVDPSIVASIQARHDTTPARSAR
jgi:mannose-6-phosphate isomerase-like protein (cupin superfamily)